MVVQLGYSRHPVACIKNRPSYEGMAPMSMDIHKARHNCVVPAVYGFPHFGKFHLCLFTGANEKNLSLIHGHSAVFNDTPFLVHCHNRSLCEQ